MCTSKNQHASNGHRQHLLAIPVSAHCHCNQPSKNVRNCIIELKEIRFNSKQLIQGSKICLYVCNVTDNTVKLLQFKHARTYNNIRIYYNHARLYDNSELSDHFRGHFRIR